MLTSTAKAREPGNPPRRTSNRHRKQGKGRMDQQQVVPSQQVKSAKIVDNES